MLSKLNCFKRKEERNVYIVKSYEIGKEEVFKRRDNDSFLHAKPSNLCSNLLPKMTILTEFRYLFFFLNNKIFRQKKYPVILVIA